MAYLHPRPPRAAHSFCDSLLEEHEEELSEAVRSAQQAHLARFLCVERAAVCEPNSVSPLP